MYCHTRPLQSGVRISLMPAPMLGHTCTSPFGSGLTALTPGYAYGSWKTISSNPDNLCKPALLS